MTLVKTSRSHIETYEKCPRKRYYQYEFDGTGLEPSDERGLKLDARIGQGVHDGIEFALQHETIGTLTEPHAAALAAGFGRGKYDKDIADSGIRVADLLEQQQTEVREGADIVTALVYAWVRVRLPMLLKEGDILAIEPEIDVDHVVGDDTVRVMTRPDIIWRRRSDGSVFIRNLKTVREPRTVWREQWALDMQTLTEPLAVDEWLRKLDGSAFGDNCQGVIIDGLITGQVLDYPRGSGKFYHNTPLLWAWVKRGDAPFGEDEWYPRYEWSCAAPHKMGNGKRCPGDKTHKLAGAVKKSVAADYPGGIIAWINHLLEEEEHVVQDQIVELPPIMRDAYAIERWKRQVLRREVEIHDNAKLIQISASNEKAFDEWLDATFPMHTASGNCLSPGKCAFYDLCWGTGAADPYAANYRPRRPHHKQEEQDG